MSETMNGWLCSCCGAVVEWNRPHLCNGSSPLPVRVVRGLDTGDIHRNAAMAQIEPELTDLRARLAAAERERDEAVSAAGRSEYGRKMMRLHLRDSLSRARRLLARVRWQRNKADAERRVYQQARDTARAEAARLREGNAALRDNIESFRYQLATIIDEEWGTQPWMDLSTLLSALSKRLFADRLDRERYREALERIAEAERLITPDGHTLQDIARAALAGKSNEKETT